MSKEEFKTGAVRSGDCKTFCYPLIPHHPLREIAIKANDVNYERVCSRTCINSSISFKLEFLNNPYTNQFLCYSAICLMAAINNKYEENALDIRIKVSKLFNPRFDLIPYEGLKAVAETFLEGAETYGYYNWEKGMDILSLQNHSIEHIRKYQKGDRSEPHLNHAIWGDITSIYSLTFWPHLNDKLRKRNVIV